MWQLLLFFFYTTTLFAEMKPYPSGIDVSFLVNQNKITKKEFLIQKQNETNTLKSSRFLRIINAVSDIPDDYDLAIVFFNKKGKKINHIIITNTTKPSPNKIFFIDRKTGKNFQGKLDVYAFPKKASSLSIGIINQKGRLLNSFSIPEFDKNNQLSLEFLKQFNPNKEYMWQIELSGTIENTVCRLNAFYFI
ncbi:MAG: hypothetical protein ACRCVW_01710 [Brevinema sp.]